MARRRKKPSKLRRWLRGIAFALLAFIVLSFAIVLPLNWVDPKTTAFMLQDDGESVAQEWVDWEDLGTALPLAVVASEDQRYAEHFGIDFKAIRKSIDERDERGYLRGGSTITQQTVKNIYLWRGRSFVRKGLEAWLAIVAEICLTKRRTLEIYLNIAELGPGIYGAGAASRHHFGKPPAALRDYEAAALAATLPNPTRLRPNPPSDYVRERRDWIVTQIQRLRREAWLTRIDNPL